MRWYLATLLTLAALVVAVVAAFTIQNSSFTVPLQLDLGVAAWKLKRPASVSVLLWSSFGVGALLAGGILGVRSARLAARVRALERELAFGGKSAAKDPWAGA